MVPAPFPITTLLYPLVIPEPAPFPTTVLAYPSSIAENAETIYAYEVGYEYPLNDGMSIKPFAYIAETAGGVGNDDTIGLGVLTTFKF